MNVDMDESKSLHDYVVILKRRRITLVLPAVALFLFFLILAISLPATYQSKATIMIEEQEVPAEYVPTASISYAAQQVQVISQRVLTNVNVAAIVHKFKLYQEGGTDSNVPQSELAKIFRENMELNLLSADSIDPRSQKPTQVTIAFTLAFKGRGPETVQQVTNELVTLFLNENVRERTDQAASATEFLSREAAKLDTELTELEQQLADFKSKNEGSLPEQYKFNVSAVERANRELSVITLRIQDLEKSKIQLVAEMAQQSPTVPLVLPSGDVVLSDLDRLKSLQSEYRRKAAIYRDNHPDVVRLAREIKALEAELGSGTDLAYLNNQLREQKATLSELRTKYNDNYHEVENVRRVIAQLEASIRQAKSQHPAEQTKTVADNPTYVFLRTQLNTTEAELRSLSERKRQLDRKSEDYETLLKLGPIVERDYKALLRDYDNAKVKYQEIRTKQREAVAVATLEQKQQGQRFLLIEPAVLPQIPISPNRKAIVFLGMVLAASAGLGAALLREAMDGTIHGIRELTAIMGEPPMVAIPYIENDLDIQQRQKAFKYSLLASVSAGIIFLLYLHLFFKPLNVIFFIVLNKLGIS